MKNGEINSNWRLEILKDAKYRYLTKISTIPTRHLSVEWGHHNDFIAINLMISKSKKCTS